ncbi:hypothetical protein Nos7524_1544 [Nostoc sp. PCC 7524]|uniref:hypothetical protein n=1 Tax=Nostoc sp. (strain ATCC 29411 / PCC 7524) TaxID=28072 RepID=UPI00029F1EC6|nr:hypothetical protein [Nostoc sp. PCC 7524]AFY47420.1 hypothetical protein Nos7524_1544 [Nostoc sp. PCC 7524]
MLSTIKISKTKNLFNSYESDLLYELSNQETSAITAGFSLKNNTDRTQTFYPFASTLSPKQRVLQPGKSGNFPGNYVLFNSSRTQFKPVIEPVKSDGEYQFLTQGDETLLRGIVFIQE